MSDDRPTEGSIEVRECHFASGRTRLTAIYPDGSIVRWLEFPGPLSGRHYVDVSPGPFHRMRTRYGAWKLRRMACRFWLDRQVVSGSTSREDSDQCG